MDSKKVVAGRGKRTANNCAKVKVMLLPCLLLENTTKGIHAHCKKRIKYFSRAYEYCESSPQPSPCPTHRSCSPGVTIFGLLFLPLYCLPAGPEFSSDQEKGSGVQNEIGSSYIAPWGVNWEGKQGRPHQVFVCNQTGR